MVRSRDAHGVINAIDASAALAMPGVLAVLTGADLAAYGGLKCTLPLKNRDGYARSATSRGRRWPPTKCASSAIRSPASSPRPSARPRTPPKRWRVDIEPLPAVVSARDAAKPGAPRAL